MHSTTASFNSTYQHTHSNATTLNDRGSNGSMGGASDLFLFDAEGLLREQKELLEKAQASELRASLFLRLRLSAQQTLTLQRNQMAERLFKQKDFDHLSSNAVPFSTPLRTTAPTQNTPVIVSNTATEELKGDEHHLLLDADANNGRVEQLCPGCTRRYTDTAAFSRHQANCKEYIALVRKANLATASMSNVVLSGDFRGPMGNVTLTSLEDLQLVQERMNAVVTSTGNALDRSRGGLSGIVAASTLSHSPSAESHYTGPLMSLVPEFGRSQRQTSLRNTGAGAKFLSFQTESQISNYSLSIQCFTPKDERIDDRDERDVRREEQEFSYSRRLTPPSPGFFTQEKLSITGVNPIDEIPASVRARSVADLTTTSVSMCATSLTPAEGDGVGGQSNQFHSCRHSSVALTSNNGSNSNMKMESEGVDEPLKPCPHCGRQFFAISRWPRHVAICENQQKQPQRRGSKSTGTTRLAYDARTRLMSQTNSVESTDPTIVSHDGKQSLSSDRGRAGSGSAPTRDSKSMDAKEETSSWRRKRAQLRQALQLSSRSSHDTNNNGDSQDDLYEDDRVGCPSCGRRFAAATAERHIPFCKERRWGTKKMMM